MMNIFLIALVLFTIISLLTDIFVFTGRWKALLYLIIPMQLGFAVFGFLAVEQVKGYPTLSIEELEKKFTYVAHFSGSSKETILLLALPEGATEPRYYKLDMSREQDKEKFRKMMNALNAAREGAAQGWPTTGVISQNEGRFDHHQNRELPPKQADSQDHLIP